METKLTFILLGVGWGGVAVHPNWITGGLSAIASILVIMNQIYIYKNRKKKSE